MISHAISASSEESHASAVSQALGIALSAFGHDAKNIHIIVDNVYQIHGIWQAFIRIFVEPDLEEEFEAFLAEKGIVDRQELEKNKKHREHEAVLAAEAVDDFEDLQDSFEVKAYNPHELAVFAYFPSYHEEAYYGFKPMHPEVNAHLIQEGSMWENIQEYFPDVDFYEATHPQGEKHKIIYDPPQTFDLNVRSPERKKAGPKKELEPHLD